MMDARLIGRPSHPGGWQLPQDQLLPRGCAGEMFLSQGHDRCLAQDCGSSSQRSSLGWWLRGQLYIVQLCFRILRIVSSSRPPVKAERGSKSCKQTAREVSLACHYRVAAPKASVGFPEAGTSWDKWVSSRHAHHVDMKPGEPGLAAGCTRHSAASSRGRPPCGAADDLAGPSHECGSAVAARGPSLR